MGCPLGLREFKEIKISAMPSGRIEPFLVSQGRGVYPKVSNNQAGGQSWQRLSSAGEICRLLAALEARGCVHRRVAPGLIT
jgi:hypothetical protein